MNAVRALSRMKLWLSIFALAAGITGLLLACTSEMPNGASEDSNGTLIPTASESTCATPNEGCPCETAGMVVACGKVRIQVGDQIQCDMGDRTCGSDNTWGDCNPENGSTRTVNSDSLRFRALLSTPTTCTSNACDPYCNQWAENASGSFDAGTDSGFTIIDGGLSPSQTGTFTISTCTGITVTPVTSSTLLLTTLTPTAANAIQFTAALTPAGCYPGTPSVIYTIDDARSDALTISSTGNVGTLTAVSPIAGPVTVVAHIGALTGSLPALVNVNVLDTSADATHASSFPATTGATDTNAFLYPYANTLFPLGLPPPIPQWTAPVAAASVKVSIRWASGSSMYQWAAITPEKSTLQIVPGSPGISIAAAPRYPNIPAAAWQYFERSAKGTSALIAIQRIVGTTLEAEVTQPITFANGQLRGNIYYQSYGTRLTYNYSGAADSTGGVTFPSGQFGAATLGIAPGALQPTVIAGKALTADTSGTYCRVCHTVSSDGSTLITQRPAGTSSNGWSQMYTNLSASTATSADITAYTDGRYSWPAIYPTGGFLFANAGVQLSYSNGPPPGGLDGSNQNVTSQFWSLATSTLGLQKTATYKTTGSTPVSIGIPSVNWGLQAGVPAYSSAGDKIAMHFYGGKVCAVGTSSNCSAEELKTGDKHSLAIMDWNNSTSTATNFRVINTESTTTPCNTTFHPSAPCTDVWPTFLPNNTGLVWEREVFHNGLVGGGLSDFGGTRGGCDNSGVCNNDGTKGEIWWSNITGAAQPVRLNNAIGLTSAGASYLPVGPNAPSTCTVSGYACTTGSNCCSGTCNGGRCTGTGTVTLKPTGAACVLATDCDSGRCVASTLRCGCAADSDCNGGTCNTLLGWCSSGVAASIPTQPYTAGHNATVEPELSYEPTMNPTPTKAADGATDEYYWMIFTSRRMFGNIATQDPWWSDPRRHDLSQTVSTKKLWVAAVKANPTAGTDPSTPAFFLPGQEWVSGNSKAYWVNNACTAGSSTLSTANLCDSTQDCCTGSSCKLDTPLTSPATRHCVPTAACSSTKGSSCSTSSDCCSGFLCSNNQCTDVPALPAYGTAATYNRDYTSPCPPATKISWGTFEYQGIFPTGTSMTVKARTADQLGDGGISNVATATPEITIGTATATTSTWTFLPAAGTSIDSLFKTAGSTSKYSLRVEMTLTPSADKTATPTLTNWRVNVECTPSE